MAEKVTHYATDGQRILCECGIGQAEIGRRIEAPRQRVGDWCSGRSRPTPDWRRALASAGICPVEAWDRPAATPTPPASPSLPAPSRPSVDKPTPPASQVLPTPPREPFDKATPDSLDKASPDDLEAYGVTGLEAVVDRLREEAPTLPPRERVQCIATEGRIHTVIANLRAKERDARLSYLRSTEFAQDMRLLSAAIPDSAAELRAALARLGVDIPAPPVAASKANRKPPSSAIDVEALVRELQTAAEWRAKGEPYLAAGHVLGLCIDVHADQIAAVLAEDAELAGRFIALLEPADEQIISSALERRIALGDVLRLPAASRRAVAQLLEAHGLLSVAAAVGTG